MTHMLQLATKLQELNFSQLMAVYEEGNRENAADRYPEEPEFRGLALAEEDFRQISYVRLACVKTIIGHGTDGYLEAVDYLNEGK